MSIYVSVSGLLVGLSEVSRVSLGEMTEFYDGLQPFDAEYIYGFV